MMGTNYVTHKDNTVSEENWLFYKKCAGWQLRFAIFPKRCNITGKRIWLEYAYRGTAFYRAGDMDMIQEHKWHDKLEHIIWKLKQ